jgi:hypothetical protein
MVYDGPILDETWRPRRLSFSPGGDQLAIVNEGRLIAWSIADEVTRAEVNMGGLLYHPLDLEWIGEDHLLMSNKYLIDFELGMPLWEYTGGNDAVSWGGQTWFVVVNNREAGAIVPARLPHAGVRRALEESPEDLWVVRPGMQVAVQADLNDPAQRDLAREKISQRLTERGFDVRETADLVLRATIERGAQREVTARITGRFETETTSYAPYQSKLEFLYRGQTVWSGRVGGFSLRYNVGFRRIDKDETFAEYVQRSNNMPYYHFDNPRFPDFVPMPSLKRELPGRIVSGVTVGVSVVTTRGLGDAGPQRGRPR